MLESMSHFFNFGFKIQYHTGFRYTCQLATPKFAGESVIFKARFLQTLMRARVLYPNRILSSRITFLRAMPAERISYFVRQYTGRKY